jgi:hypothetical protein
MKYTVLWSPYAESKLARIWMSGSDRQHITDAADALDNLLSRDAHIVGESRTGTRRIVHHSPLGVIFQ